MTGAQWPCPGNSLQRFLVVVIMASLALSLPVSQQTPATRILHHDGISRRRLGKCQRFNDTNRILAEISVVLILGDQSDCVRIKPSMVKIKYTFRKVKYRVLITPYWLCTSLATVCPLIISSLFKDNAADVEISIWTRKSRQPLQLPSWAKALSQIFQGSH